MAINKKAILLILLTLQTFYVFSQNLDFFSDSIRARVLNRKAIILGMNSMHLQALNTFFYSLELRKKIYGNEHYNLGAVYSGIGIQYLALGQNDKSLEFLSLAEYNYRLRESYKTDPRIRLYRNFGNVFRSKLDFKEALRYYQESMNICSNQVNSSEEEIAEANYYLAEIYYLTNEYDKSLKLINQNIKNAYTEDQIMYYELLAFINQINDNTFEARKNYQSAIDLTTELYGDNHINVAIEYINFTLFLLSNNEFKSASEVLEKAYNNIKITQPEFGNELADYYDLKGYYYRNLPIEKQDVKSFAEEKKRNLNKAINYYLKALTALKFPVPYSIEDINSSENWLSLMDCINFLKRIGDTYKEIAGVEQNRQSEKYTRSLTDAIESYKIVGELIQKARMELSSDESKIQLTGLEYSTFQNLIETAFDTYSATNNHEFIELAFQSAERIKSSSVFDKLSNESALENSLIPDSLIQMEKRFNNTISIFSEKLFEENSEDAPDTTKINNYNTKIFEASRKREELNRYLESEYSDYYELKYSASLLSISEIQHKLAHNEIILEYILNEKDSLTELYTFVISKNRFDLIKQDVGGDFLKSIESVFHFMSDREYILTTNRESKKFCVSSNQLYKKLILPFVDEIQNKKITIVPDGKLSYIAFDGLLQNLPDTSKIIQFNKLDYLIKKFTINYSNSSNLLFKNSSSTKKIFNKAIAFAPEYQSDTFEIANQKIVLIPLPGAQKEVEDISKIINTKVFKGTEATEINFRNNTENYDILHLAMHAYINDSLPGFSRLAFSLDTSNVANSDGWLNTADIYNLNINAKLTVLSACNTGSGQLKKGEGIMSLARGFFYAGCPAIIMSLWEVEDQSGTQIMGSFYKNLKKGKAKDESLRQAKLEYLENSNSRRAHPHYWLGYINIGDNSPLYKSYDFYFFSLLILALIGISIDQTIRIKKARKKRAS